MSRAGSIVKRTLVSFYDDQMTHHAAALTYYSLMSLFPALLLALSLLGLVGQYPATYNAILGYLRDVAPESLLDPLDSSLRGASGQGNGDDDADHQCRRWRCTARPGYWRLPAVP